MSGTRTGSSRPGTGTGVGAQPRRPESSSGTKSSFLPAVKSQNAPSTPSKPAPLSTANTGMASPFTCPSTLPRSPARGVSPAQRGLSPGPRGLSSAHSHRSVTSQSMAATSSAQVLNLEDETYETKETDVDEWEHHTEDGNDFSSTSSPRIVAGEKLPSDLDADNTGMELQARIALSRSQMNAAHIAITNAINHNLKLTRTRHEQRQLQLVGEQVDAIMKEHAFIINKFESEIKAMLSARLHSSVVQNMLESLQEKLSSLNFDSWTDQIALQESITSLENDIRRLSATSILKQPPYQYAIHPVANLVAKKFMRLEEIIYLLKKQLASVHASTGLSTTTTPMLSPHSLSSPTSKDTMNNVEQTTIVTQFGSLQGLLRDNAALKKRNTTLLQALKQLRHHPQTQAAMQLMSPEDRLHINAMVTPALTRIVADEYTSLSPSVFTLLSQYEPMIIQIFEYYAKAAGVSVDEDGEVKTPPMTTATTAQATATVSSPTSRAPTLSWGSTLLFARDFGLSPSHLSRTQLQQLFRVCTESSQFIIDTSVDRMTLTEFKELIARIAMTIYVQGGMASSSSALYVTQVDSVQALLHRLDLTEQERVYTRTLGNTIPHSSSGVMGYLLQQDMCLRQVYIFYAKPVGGTTIKRLTTNAPDRTILRMDRDAFIRFTTHFGIIPTLLTVEQIGQVYDEACIAPMTLTSRTRGKSAGKSRVSTANNTLLTYPIFKQTVARLALLSHEMHPTQFASSTNADDKDPALHVVMDWMRHVGIAAVDEDDLRNRLNEFARADHSRVLDPSLTQRQHPRDVGAETRREMMASQQRLHRQQVQDVDDEDETERKRHHRGWSVSSASTENLVGTASPTHRSDQQHMLTYMNHSASTQRVDGSGTDDETLSQFEDELRHMYQYHCGDAHGMSHDGLIEWGRTFSVIPQLISLQAFTALIPSTPLSYQQFRTFLIPLAHAIPTSVYHGRTSPVAVLINYLTVKYVYEWKPRQGHVSSPAKSRNTSPSRPKAIRHDIPSPHDEPIKQHIQHQIAVQVHNKSRPSSPISTIDTLVVHEDDEEEDEDEDEEEEEKEEQKKSAPVGVNPLPLFPSVLSPSTSSPLEFTFAWLKPDVVAANRVPTLLAAIRSHRFDIVAQQQVTLTEDNVNIFYREHVGKNWFPQLVHFMTSGPAVALVLRREHAIRVWRDIAGPTSTETAKATAPNSIRAQFGTDGTRNAVHGSDSIAAATREIDLVFSGFQPKQTSLLIIRPDAVAAGKVDTIVKQIEGMGFTITRHHQFQLTPEQVQQLFAAQLANRYFVQEQGIRVQMLSQGPVWVGAITGDYAVQRLRDYAISNIDIYVSPNVVMAQQEVSLMMDTFAPKIQSTFAFIKPDAVSMGYVDEIMNRIIQEGFEIVEAKHMTLETAQAEEFYKEHVGRPFFPTLVSFMTSGPVVAMELKKENGIKAWRALCGPTNSLDAKKTSPNSLRALYGTDNTRNCVHGSDSEASAAREIQLVLTTFKKPIQTTLALIKPDAVIQGHAPAIIERIKKMGFTFLRNETLKFTDEEARTFYAEHVGRPFYPLLIRFMTAAPLIALALERENAIVAWHELMGPTNPEVAKEKAPRSIRALFGTDTTRNACHGSDSEASAARELNLVFEQICPVDQTTFALIKPDAVASVDAILDRIHAAGFDIVRHQRVRFTPDHVRQFYAEHLHKTFFEELLGYMTSGSVYALALRRAHAVNEFRKLIGPTDPVEAKQIAPDSLRALFGTDKQHNGLHGSDSLTTARREYDLVFNQLWPPVQTTFAWIKPDAVAAGHVDAILQRITAEGFEIVRQRKVQLNTSQAQTFYKEHTGRPFFDGLVTFMTSGPAVALILRRENGISAWRNLAGPTNSIEAKTTAPTSIRALYGTDQQRNAVHDSDSVESATREIEFVFTTLFPEMQTTFAMIKPDAVSGGHTEEIIQRIKAEGFEILNRTKIQLTQAQAAEFYQVHVARQFFKKLCAFLTSGPIVALALRRENAIKRFRDLCGPTDPTQARIIAPSSIRAQFGTDTQHNAIHGSDSVESANIELELMFTQFVAKIQSTCALIKPDAYARRHTILTTLQQRGFEIVQRETQHWNLTQAMRFYAEHAGTLYYNDLLSYITSGPMLVLTLRKEDAIDELRKEMGPTDSTVAKQTHPDSLRALFGLDRQRNAIHGSDSITSATRELELVWKQFSAGVQTTFAWIKPDALAAGHANAIINRIQSEGFDIVRQVKRQLTPAQAEEFYAEHIGRPFFSSLITFMTSGPVIALSLKKEDAVRDWRTLAGPTNPEQAKKESPQSIRALYGTSVTQNAVHGSDSVASAEREIELTFNNFFVGVQSTFAMIKPDAVKNQFDLPILQRIRTEGFEIIRQKHFTLTVEQAKTFYIEHKDREFFPGLIEFMTSGPIVALELRRENAIKGWRQVAGPTNSITARATAPHSIRALYGTDGQKNAVHGSDSLDSSYREMDLMFNQVQTGVTTTLGIIKPDVVKKAGDEAIVKKIQEAGFDILARKRLKLTVAQVKTLYQEHTAKPYFKGLIEYMTSGPVLALALKQNFAIPKWRSLIGPVDAKKSAKKYPQALRTIYGTDVLKNGFYGSDSPESAARDLDLVFPEFNFALLS